MQFFAQWWGKVFPEKGGFHKELKECPWIDERLWEMVDEERIWPLLGTEVDFPQYLNKVFVPDHLTCLLRNLCGGQEAIVRTGHGTTDWFRIGKWVCRGCILQPCLFNLYAEYIMQNAGQDETQAGIKIARRNINDLRYEDHITFIAESEEELKSLLMKIKEWKGWLKTQYLKN